MLQLYKMPCCPFRFILRRKQVLDTVVMKNYYIAFIFVFILYALETYWIPEDDEMDATTKASFKEIWKTLKDKTG